NPVSTSIQLVRKAHIQLILSSFLGGASALSGMLVSYALDWPVGATIAIISTIMLVASSLTRFIVEIGRKRLLSRLVGKSTMAPQIKR
ncbi:MAG: metal ABC transporter permease, partial [Candidatus Korarchaeota archaeon]|nr:metal ABC transporter permease [Candidatus Korarchaeota archaeon]